MSGSGRDDLPKIRVCLGVPRRFAGVVGRPSWMSGSCREALPDVRKWSGDLF